MVAAIWLRPVSRTGGSALTVTACAVPGVRVMGRSKAAPRVRVSERRASEKPSSWMVTSYWPTCR
jgi:hypothetical protein